ncbi:hypothetical protein ACFQZV_05505 [Microbacterium koreense]|uniref:DUF2892 domain-containing protein n=1 Tax=Microbacterium koreense TaxID=323761 RepID=A0ABW2ZQ52_9MICO
MGASAVFVGAVALSMLDQPWWALPAALCAAVLAVGAITGRCLGDLIPVDAADTTPTNTLGYDEAPQPIAVDVTAGSSEKRMTP